ncbi:HEAT repeat domain-containing protein [Pontiella agarivorans]|uniref:HEAT repeat domain-containing protein n=1 Tax=Pontiella agarivorans TaxID=3038953 RepID=A0ABU5MYJ9_9BACT|nr:HEAT repeat domain-containing protein [Pontiella agarivorans]MDZ8119263.1 HEAT repeat domain-containing protein [Pontiella agarivorans]
MMNKRLFSFIYLITFAVLLGLTGCSRTVDDISKWKAGGNVEKLIKALQDPKYEVRLAATEALGDLKAEQAIDDLAALYNDSEDEIVMAAVEALAEIGTPAAVTPLSAALKLDFSESRTIAAEKLGALKAAGAVPQLVDALDDSEAAVQLAAAKSLGQIGDPSASAGLAGKIDDPSADLRLASVESLGRCGGDSAIAALIRALGDSETHVSNAAIASLETLGDSTKPSVLNALKSENSKIRSGAIAVLRRLKAVPTTGNDLIWYQLARASVDSKQGIDKGVVANLVKMGDAAVDTLLQAAAHPVEAFREHAAFALERMGRSVVERVVAEAEAKAGTDAKKWMAGRGSWPGAPSWRIDLWASLSALDPTFSLDHAVVSSLEMQARPAFNVIINPKFEVSREYIPLLIALLGDTTMPPPEQPDFDDDGIPVIKEKRDMFRGEANRTISEEKLSEAGYKATLPLIAAIEDDDELIPGNAAHILGSQGEKRALHPLMKVVNKKLEAGEILTDSPFYVALQKLDEPAAEPLLMKIRPNPDRALRVFSRQYDTIRPVSAETEDESGDVSQPVRFRIGYINGSRIGEMIVTFMPDRDQNWVPNPPLPEQIPPM